MVSHTGKKTRPAQLRPLNQPVPLSVTPNDKGLPHELIINRHYYQVERIQDTWIIEDEWWRNPIQRQYFSLLLNDGSRRTIFHDRVANAWYLQDY